MLAAGQLNDVACASAATCVAVGATLLGAASAATGVVVPVTEGVADDSELVSGTEFLDDVACPSATMCEALGGNDAGQTVLVTITVPTPCSTTVTGEHVGTIVASSGLTCVSGARLTGNIVVNRGAAIDIESATVIGPFSASAPSTVRMCDTTLVGSVGVTGATGSVLVGDAGNGCSPNNIGGSLTLQHDTGGVVATGNQVGGTVTISG